MTSAKDMGMQIKNNGLANQFQTTVFLKVDLWDGVARTLNMRLTHNSLDGFFCGGYHPSCSLVFIVSSTVARDLSMVVPIFLWF